jgi:hypothetical protein
VSLGTQSAGLRRTARCESPWGCPHRRALIGEVVSGGLTKSDIWLQLPRQVPLTLMPVRGDESKAEPTASFISGSGTGAARNSLFAADKRAIHAHSLQMRKQWKLSVSCFGNFCGLTQVESEADSDAVAGETFGKSF